MSDTTIKRGGGSGNAKGHPNQCTANSKRTHQRCGRYAVPGRTTCKFHGGKTPVGIANPSFKHGRYSKHLPKNYGESYAEAMNDPEILNLRSALALNEARIVELTRRIDSGESGALYRKLKEASTAFKEARLDGDAPRMNASLDKMEKLIDQGVADGFLWTEIGDRLEQRRKITESEQKRLVAMKTMVTQDRMDAMLNQVITIIERNVKDTDLRSAIGKDFAALVMHRSYGEQEQAQ